MSQQFDEKAAIQKAQENYPSLRGVNDIQLAVQARTVFIQGAKYQHEQTRAVIEKLVECVRYYANHESVIKEAYHSNDEKQITCVHTFINHKAKETLAEMGEG